MSLVTFSDRAKALRMLGTDTAPLSDRDQLLFSLARQTTWTDKQRELIDTMWSEHTRMQTGSPGDAHGQ